MDRASVAHLFGTCFAEALRERIMDDGGYVAGERICAEMSRQYNIPAEYVERVTGYAVRNGAVEVRELADESTVMEFVEGYQPSTTRILCLDALRAEDRGDYPVRYGAVCSGTPRTATPAVLFPESTMDTVTSGEDQAAKKTTKRSGNNWYALWYNAYQKRREENARIIAESKTATKRTDYTADPLSGVREEIEDKSCRNAHSYFRKEMQELGCTNTRRANVRRNHWTEAERLINWLYNKPGRMQELEALYYERGAHSPEDREVIRKALNELKEAGKVVSTRRGGRRVAKLAARVRPRRYIPRDYANIAEQEMVDETEDSSPEQSFDPQVMAEMSAAGAGYTEGWDS